METIVKIGNGVIVKEMEVYGNMENLARVIKNAREIKNTGTDIEKKEEPEEEVEDEEDEEDDAKDEVKFTFVLYFSKFFCFTSIIEKMNFSFLTCEILDSCTKSFPAYPKQRDTT